MPALDLQAAVKRGTADFRVGPKSGIRKQMRAIILVSGDAGGGLVFLRCLAPDHRPKNDDQEQRRGRPVKPDVIEAAKYIDQEQEAYDRTYRCDWARQAQLPLPNAGEDSLCITRGVEVRRAPPSCRTAI